MAGGAFGAAAGLANFALAADPLGAIGAIGGGLKGSTLGHLTWNPHSAMTGFVNGTKWQLGADAVVSAIIAPELLEGEAESIDVGGALFDIVDSPISRFFWEPYAEMLDPGYWMEDEEIVNIDYGTKSSSTIYSSSDPSTDAFLPYTKTVPWNFSPAVPRIVYWAGAAAIDMRIFDGPKAGWRDYSKSLVSTILQGGH